MVCDLIYFLVLNNIYSSTVVKVLSFGEYSRINRFEFLLVLRYRIWLVVFRCFDKYCKKKFARASFTLFFQSRLGLTIDSQSHGVQCQHHSPWHWQSRWLWQTESPPRRTNGA